MFIDGGLVMDIDLLKYENTALKLKTEPKVIPALNSPNVPDIVIPVFSLPFYSQE
jgi:hypothetical protein